MNVIIPTLYGIGILTCGAYITTVSKPNGNHFALKEELHANKISTAAEATVPLKNNVKEEAQAEKKQSAPIPKDINVTATTPKDGIVAKQINLIKKENNLIPVDDNVTYGTLKNGMAYIYLKNQNPKDQISLRLHVGAGSLNEAEDQRGIAHFLEHMVFNGTKNYPDAKKLIPKMQRLGISFGAHANAYTSFNETVYMLDLPNTQKDTLDLAFNVMQDFAGGALLEESEIEEERGVISSEKTSRDSVDLRIAKKMYKDLLPESLIPQRFPIGTEEVIQNAKRDRFTDFYTRFYRPKNMFFVVVGNLSLKEAKSRIENSFEAFTEPENPGPPPSVGKITEGRGFQTAVYTDKELTETELSLVTVSPHTQKADTAKNRAQKIPLILANQILSKRFSELTLNDPQSPITTGSSYRYVLFKEVTFGSINVTAKNNDWKKALPTLVQEYKRVMEHGFTPAELSEAKKNLLTSYKNRVKSAGTRKSKDLASSLISNYYSQRVFSTPETDLKIVEEALKSITPELCHNLFYNFWATQDIHLTLTTTDKFVEKNSQDTLASLFRREIVKETTPLENQVAQEFAYNFEAKTGEISRSTHIPDLNITQLILSNGVKVNLKQTDFKANSINLTASIGDGKLSLPLNKPGIEQLTSSVMNAGGLSKHSISELNKILAGKSVGWDFSISDDCFTLSGATTTDDLEYQLKLLTALISDPGYRPEAERLFRSELDTLYKSLKHSQQGGMEKMRARLAGNDPRFTFPIQEHFNEISTEDVQEWITPIYESAPLELSIVGDFDTKQLKELLKNTLATLPKRNAKRPNLEKQTQVKRLKLPHTEKIYFDSKIPTGTSIVTWRTPKLNKNIAQVRRLNILASILSDRMRIKLREELGIAYSPGAYSNVNAIFSNSSYIIAYSPGKPQDIEQINKVSKQIAADLHKNGATQDELQRALEPVISSFAESSKTNGYWLNTVMKQLHRKPHQLDWSRSREKSYKSIKLKEINALAKKFLAEKNSAAFQILPNEINSDK